MGRRFRMRLHMVMRMTVVRVVACAMDMGVDRGLVPMVMTMSITSRVCVGNR